MGQKQEYSTLVSYMLLLGFMVVGFCVAGIIEGADYETGVVREKKNNAIYLSPIDGTLVNRKITFENMSHVDSMNYAATKIGDTLRFINPGHYIEIRADNAYEHAILNSKDMMRVRQEYEGAKKLQQIQSEARQK